MVKEKAKEKAKEKIKDREFCSAQEIMRSLSDAWSDLTLEDIQRVFLE
jgi:hypothetical protein